MSERLQKLLAAAGLGSRRQLEDWIKAKRVTVNGQVAELGMKASPEDDIRVDGRPVRVHEDVMQTCKVLAYHKPEGEVTTRSDPEGRPTVFERLPRLRRGRWIVIGRLDTNTSGLLLFTTDGELAHRLMHPSGEIQREYAVRVLGEVDALVLERLQKGVDLEDGPARFEQITDGGGAGLNHWYHVILREGRNREVRRLWESQGVTVSRLMRVRYGPIHLPKDLPRGRSRELAPADVDALRTAVGLPPVAPAVATPSAKPRGRPRHAPAGRRRPR